MTMGWRRGWAGVFAIAITACGPKTIGANDEGMDSGEGSGTGSAGTTIAESEDTAAPTGIVGVWLGYVDQASFASGSDRVQLEITAVAADGAITGTAAFGEEGTLPPAVDPEVGYPEDYESFGQIMPLERFAFTLTGEYDESLSRLQAVVGVTEVWAGWCALQTPYDWGGGSWECLPNCGFSSGANGCRLNDCPQRPGEVDCGKLELCRGLSNDVCLCNANDCTNDPSYTITLDLHLAGDALEGPVDQLGTAFLSRQ